ncbi:DUF397 domain-containing protein [Nocardia veterana]|uniref:DUF397 domain-containing protein n=1 Tax=Nocardia veterana TaxID=132249 RepID=A0A7X6RK32_9NOCA|nr:DUF397 domain-containing protein [Nocardia veterana]NKY88835.1 DUF397 domain-containing protein [Nocardia veterana]
MRQAGEFGRRKWYKSSFSKDANSCVEVRFTGNAVDVRDSKYVGPEQDQPIITVPADQWPAFLGLVMTNSSGVLPDAVAVDVHADGGATITHRTTRLNYNADEWDAFLEGVADGQFDRS